MVVNPIINEASFRSSFPNIWEPWSTCIRQIKTPLPMEIRLEEFPPKGTRAARWPGEICYRGLFDWLPHVGIMDISEALGLLSRFGPYWLFCVTQSLFYASFDMVTSSFSDNGRRWLNLCWSFWRVCLPGFISMRHIPRQNHKFLSLLLLGGMSVSGFPLATWYSCQ